MSGDRTTPANASLPAGGTVHWIGTGLSSGRSGLGVLSDRAERLVVWDRTAERARLRLAALGLADRAEARALGRGALEAEVRAGDVVVSMLPATEHAGLLRLAVARRAHFACTSYTSPELAEWAQAASTVGVVVLTEAGLDPGIDHLMAHLLVERARREVGDTAASVAFTSYCGGIPAVPNDFRYRFSWAPYGVLAALGSPARYIEEGRPRTATRPWQATRTLVLAGEAFEVYPNRDSLPFVAQYGIPDGWELETFVRGTLRNAGWRAAWTEVFDTVLTGDETRVRALAKELADRYPTTDADRDRVVLSIELTVRDPDGGTRWRGAHLLDVTGDESESAMARCVSLPLAHGVTRILDGALPAGLNRAADSADEAARWMDFLSGHGVRSTFDCPPDTTTDPHHPLIERGDPPKGEARHGA
ncbi:saccharopine dehydrogenase family protein [Streptomyces ipomoeae]|uniref:Saccharopine dehydrogenase n=1 Tax=Streptomyces ipomoeae 91-03 TaxID=698759 RepID=L1L150_9ACTN|nr:saccharopine dehydrogenase family protein [Streptomyces ipomoeae]EKX66328.1 saccharopine dehydrogenase [Streptomyces ipomoeae 91-03]MDX2696285.1 saccharopine dehydrogenase NADP-binding domain-containing protein [Streptomyces ipomoeae]MDX2842054.1 saccharopine dehydrogenase NADP-binding domain-containing protein [Streptomyces ipomoeae]TQE37592.1 saccharopine dehydrogenase [Streptomyces ipomoeae]